MEVNRYRLTPPEALECRATPSGSVAQYCFDCQRQQMLPIPVGQLSPTPGVDTPALTQAQANAQAQALQVGFATQTQQDASLAGVTASVEQIEAVAHQAVIDAAMVPTIDGATVYQPAPLGVLDDPGALYAWALTHHP
jgi:hypothetical protein